MTAAVNILVVDDEPNGFDVIEALLFREGYEVHYAANGFAALEYLETTLPDVILLDVMMPEMDGLEVCQRVKSHKDWQHIPIVMVTALSSKEDLGRCLDAGADDFISKPITGIELRARTRSMLRIKQQYDALATALQLREDLSHSVVHDLRNPITSITLAIEILNSTDLDSKQSRKVNQMGRSVQQLRSMTDQLLVLAKADAGKMLLNRQTCSIADLVAETVANFDDLAQAKKINIKYERSLNADLNLDRDLIGRTIENLLANAIKFSPSQSEIAIALHSQDDAIAIEIADQGKGITPELQQAIFERYEVGQIMPGIQQTGLGLAFCKLIVEAHDGQIWAESNDPQGAVFTIQLPTPSPSATKQPSPLPTVS